ncbi:C3a anaphylatoxin chemotactic receptor-like [Pristis pectinata]|uniref:C3a anaphylatoxin chemotactic receptor-like n=1 Tax=Pristis pectinata TaxID=685728 RepID=UPI00223E69A4|nr:C3a anaphylatoxin chemotactic receptor-like [Pristis pectinata]
MSLSGNRSNSTLGGNFSSSDYTPGDLSIPWRASTVLFIIITALTLLLGVPGNGAVVWVTGFKVKRGVHTMCFLNLAVADLSYCLTLPFLVSSYFVLRPWPQDKLPWVFLLSAIALNTSASAFLLTMISIFRCLAVTRPIWFHQQLGQAWVRLAWFGVWGLAFLASLPYLLIEQVDLYFGQKTLAVLDVTWAVLTFGLPVAIMAACYLVIGRVLCRDQFTKSRKPVRLIVTVVAAFIVCWLPSTVCSLLQAFSQPVTTEWNYITFGLASFNSALNPLLYVLSGRDLRQVFRRSLAASLYLAFTEEGVPRCEQGLKGLGWTQTRRRMFWYGEEDQRRHQAGITSQLQNTCLQKEREMEMIQQWCWALQEAAQTAQTRANDPEARGTEVACRLIQLQQAQAARLSGWQLDPFKI